jgi:hypothetical protein
MSAGELAGAGAILAAILLSLALVRLVMALADWLDRHNGHGGPET